MRELLDLVGSFENDHLGSGSRSIGIQRIRETLSAGPMRAALDALEAPATCLSVSDVRALSELFAWTNELVDIRAPRQKRVLLWAGRSSLGFAVLFGFWLALRPQNLALGREVTASSICHHTRPPPYSKKRLHRVVDGVVRESNFAMCTNIEVHPWIQVDLEKDRTITSVVVHTRSDCCWGFEAVPLSIQLSTDGEHFETVAVRKDFIVVDFPWKARLPSKTARYVRLTNESEQPRDIVIGELEVYGR